MPIDITSRIAFALPQPTDVLLQFEAADMARQRIITSETRLGEPLHCTRVPAQHGVGERIWMQAVGRVVIEYAAQVETDHAPADLAQLPRMELYDLPGEATEFLFDSRYCHLEPLHDFVTETFDGLFGGTRVLAMRDWIAGNLSYERGSSDANTTATHTLDHRRGICRDYAHVMIAFARASGIPARYVSCYAPGVDPQDFHAIAEVFLADPVIPGLGAWQLVDATHMADPASTVRIGVGRDAADVSFLTVFGAAEFERPEVTVRELAEAV